MDWCIMFMPKGFSSFILFFAMWPASVLILGCVFFQNVIAQDISPGLGEVLDDSDLEKMPRHIFADGNGLPSGSGETLQGKEIYDNLCASCHGDKGQGGSAMELVGDRSLLATEFPDRGIAVYWPFAPTLFEYIKRAMPPDKPNSLGENELYAVIARLLELNGLIKSGQRVNAEFLSSLQMPNKDNFRSGYVESE